MLQRWASDREFYIIIIGGSTLLCQFIEPDTFARYAFIFCIAEYHFGRIFRYTYTVDAE